MPMFTRLASIGVFAVALITSLPADAQHYPDLVSRTAFRVCSDPSNLPFSNRKQQGFENKIAEIFGQQLKEPVRYLWAPSGPGFARNTLNADLCDVIMGYTVGSELVQSTNPYYRSTYVIVAKKGSPLNGVETLDDPRLKGHTLGVFAATPPVDVMLSKGLMDKAQVYPLLVDHRFDSPLTTMMSDLQNGKTDAVVVWGPLIGWDVVKSSGSLVMSPLLKEVNRPGFSYRISLGVRHDELDWKHKLDAVLRSRRVDINKVLVDYGVPLIDESGKLIPPSEAVDPSAPALGMSARPSHDFKRSDEHAASGAGGFHMPGPAPTNAQP